jgi:hypothetical protein
MNNHEEALNQLLQPFVGEINDSITRQKVCDVFRDYVLDTLVVNDITTCKEIDKNSLTAHVSVLGKEYTVIVSPGDEHPFSINTNIKEK